MDSDLLADLDDLGDDYESDGVTDEGEEEDNHVDIKEQMTAGHKALLESVRGVDDVHNLVKLHKSPQLLDVLKVGLVRASVLLIWMNNEY
jgi:hypothetical protein